MGSDDPQPGPSASERRRLGATFDGVAELYDEVRPRYPEPMVERILERAALPEGGRILEVGAGPGNATLAFARRGYAMVCLEPGRALAVRCRSHCAAHAGVEVHETTFEDWPLEAAAFDLLISGQAFHWTDPETATGRAADALRPGGWLALFWSRPVEEDEPSAVALAVARAYAEHAPALLGRGGRSIASLDARGRIEASGRFGPVCEERFAWSRRYDAEQYGKLERTHSDHLALPPWQLDRLVEAVVRAIEAHGGVFPVRYETLLLMARRHP